MSVFILLVCLDWFQKESFFRALSRRGYKIVSFALSLGGATKVNFFRPFSKTRRR